MLKSKCKVINRMNILRKYRQLFMFEGKTFFFNIKAKV